ncbi:MAG: TrmO family methyltransferase, partial [Flavobacteriales bacterium]
MRALLARPYPLDPNTLHHVGRAVLFGVFVAAFLGVFRPFGLHGAAHLGLLAAAFGGTCTAVMLLLNVGMPHLLPRWFDEARWTVARELSWTLLNVAAIGLANALLATALGLAPLSASTLGRFTLFTVLIGLFPIGLSVLRLVDVRGLTLEVEDLDLVDGTPVLDIKPYVPWTDAIPTAKT